MCLYQVVDSVAVVGEELFTVRISLHDQIHVELKGLELIAIILVSIAGELVCDFFEAMCKSSASFISLRDLLLLLKRRGGGELAVDEVRSAHGWGELWRWRHCHFVADRLCFSDIGID
jgi:hypothetical protein